MLKPAILQFGTGRFLLAHVDLFVSDALAAGRAAGGILVVQTTGNSASSARTAALAGPAGYPVRIRGLERGQPVDRTLHGRAICEAVHADSAWPRVCEAIGSQVRVIVSNTADTGYRLDAGDDASLLRNAREQANPEHRARVPRSFPAKLLVLLHRRWLCWPDEPLSIFPCELVERNGDTLRDIVCALAERWSAPEPFRRWLAGHCVWVNSLVDRIVSEAIEPVGAVAEPYALWAIERRAGMVLPCTHPAIVLTETLEPYARLKLFLLNGGHSFLAECWLRDRLASDMTVAGALHDAALRDELEALWHDEMLPVFAAIGERESAERYLVTLRGRLSNPFLQHRLADIAQNHAHKLQRRFAPIVLLAAQHGLSLLPQPRLRAALDRGGVVLEAPPGTS